MHFVNKNEKLLKKYESVWNKISNIIRKTFGKQLDYSGKYLDTKLKSSNDKINAGSYDKKYSKNCIFILFVWQQ